MLPPASQRYYRRGGVVQVDVEADELLMNQVTPVLSIAPSTVVS